MIAGFSARAGAFAVLALLMASCADTDGPPPDESGAQPASPVTEDTAPGAAEPSAAATASEAPAAGTSAAEPPNAETQKAALPPVEPPPPPPMPPDRLIGMDRRAITDLLGRPAFRRTDAPAELWRYRSGRCILDLFLYPPENAPDGPLSVTYVEARQRDGAPLPAVECLDAVRKAHAGGGGAGTT